MDSGKSTLALQTAHNHKSRGRSGLIFTNKDRAGSGVISSRLGLKSDAIEVEPDLDIHKFVVEHLSMGDRIDYIICDEAQFYQPDQIDGLAKIVDGLGIDVYAFGILADFRTKLFPGSARLVELADRVNTLQVEALCWCGSRATHNARTVNGVMVTEGEQVVVGDVGPSLQFHQVGRAGVGDVAVGGASHIDLPALLHQQVVEHLLAEVVRIAGGDVLQVAGAVHEHHHRILLARLQLRGAVQLGVDLPGAMGRRHLHELRFDPGARAEFRRARVGQPDHRTAAA